MLTFKYTKKKKKTVIACGSCPNKEQFEINQGHS